MEERCGRDGAWEQNGKERSRDRKENETVENYDCDVFEILRENNREESISEDGIEDEVNTTTVSKSEQSSSYYSYRSVDSHSSEVSDQLVQNETALNLACANARSIAKKIDSLITLFEENHLHFAILTETWLTNKLCPPRVLNDLAHGANLSFIRRDRGSRGGGVAICYNPNKIRFTKFPASQQDKTEIVCAVGNCQLTRRKIIAISVYIPPSLTAAELRTAVESMIDCLNRALMKYEDPIVFVGGDFNNKNISQFTDTFQMLLPTRAGATRAGAALDEIYSNVAHRIVDSCIQKPLCTPEGIESDHSIVAVSVTLPRQPKQTTNTFSFRPVTKQGTCLLYTSDAADE